MLHASRFLAGRTAQHTAHPTPHPPPLPHCPLTLTILTPRSRTPPAYFVIAKENVFHHVSSLRIRISRRVTYSV